MDFLTRQVKPVQRRNRKKPLSEEISQMYRVLCVTLTLMFLASSGAHLWVNASKSTNGYTLRELQTVQEELEYESRQLQHMVLLAQSLENLEDADQLNLMIAPEKDETSYLGPTHISRFQE